MVSAVTYQYLALCRTKLRIILRIKLIEVVPAVHFIHSIVTPHSRFILTSLHYLAHQLILLR